MTEPAPAVPAPELAVSGVRAEPFAATPYLEFALRLTDASRRQIYTIALTAQIRIDADRRGYDEETRERLVDLFGAGERLPETAGALRLGRVDLLVPSFAGEGTATIALPCSGDLEQAGARYLAALGEGTVPLTFDFSGSVLYRGDAGRLQVAPVPWSCSARYRMPARVWQELMQRRHGGSGFVRLHPETLERARRRRVERGLPTLEAAILDALRESV